VLEEEGAASGRLAGDVVDMSSYAKKRASLAGIVKHS
jgi:hypothetical protein